MVVAVAATCFDHDSNDGGMYMEGLTCANILSDKYVLGGWFEKKLSRPVNEFGISVSGSSGI